MPALRSYITDFLESRGDDYREVYRSGRFQLYERRGGMSEASPGDPVPAKPTVHALDY